MFFGKKVSLVNYEIARLIDKKKDANLSYKFFQMTFYQIALNLSLACPYIFVYMLQAGQREICGARARLSEKKSGNKLLSKDKFGEYKNISISPVRL